MLPRDIRLQVFMLCLITRRFPVFQKSDLLRYTLREQPISEIIKRVVTMTDLHHDPRTERP